MIGDYVEQIKKLYNQGLFEESSVAKERIGQLRPLDDGRLFVYARAGAVTLAPGKLMQMPVPITNHINQAVAAEAALGGRRVYVTLGATIATKDYYKDGVLLINDAAGEGHCYKIRGHKEIASAGSGWIELYDALRLALTAASEYTLLTARQASLIIHPSPPTALVAGVPPMAITALYYFWNQVKGFCPVLVDGTLVIGNQVQPSISVDGAVSPLTHAHDLIVATAGGAADHVTTVAAGALAFTTGGTVAGGGSSGVQNAALPLIVGSVIVVNADTEYALIDLQIPGY